MGFPRLQDASVGVRLGAAFGTLVFLLLATVTFGVLLLSSLNGTMHALLDNEIRASVLSAKLVGQAHETSAALGRAVMDDNIDAIQAEIKHAEKTKSDSMATAKLLGEALEHEQERALLKKIEA